MAKNSVCERQWQHLDISGSGRNEEPKIVHWKPLLVLTVFYYFISCGVERIYQPMVHESNIVICSNRSELLPTMFKVKAAQKFNGARAKVRQRDVQGNQVEFIPKDNFWLVIGKHFFLFYLENTLSLFYRNQWPKYALIKGHIVFFF